MMKATIDAKELNRMIKATKKMVANPIQTYSREDLKYIRVDFDVEKQQAIAAACNGFAIAVEMSTAFTVSDIDEDFTIYLRPVPLKLSKDRITVELIDGACRVTDDNVTIDINQPDAAGTDILQLLAEQENTPVQFKTAVNLSLLSDAVCALKPSCKANDRVFIEFRGADKTIVFKSTSGSKRAIMPIRVEEEE